MTKKKPRSKREKATALTPKDAVSEVVAPEAFKHLAESLRVYLDAHGWTVTRVGVPAIVGELDSFQVLVPFTGGRQR